jgi:hypothetical protein
MTTPPLTPATTDQPTDPAAGGWFRRTAIAHPIILLLGLATAFVWATQMASALMGVDLMPAKLAELLLLHWGCHRDRRATRRTRRRAPAFRRSAPLATRLALPRCHVAHAAPTTISVPLPGPSTSLSRRR